MTTMREDDRPSCDGIICTSSLYRAPFDKRRFSSFRRDSSKNSPPPRGHLMALTPLLLPSAMAYARYRSVAVAYGDSMSPLNTLPADDFYHHIIIAFTGVSRRQKINKKSLLESYPA